MDSVLGKIEEYYIEHHKNKIFCRRLCVDGKNFNILYDYEKQDEIEKFVSNFTAYLPYYVYNEDSLECIDTNKTIEGELLRISKEIWRESPSMPRRKTAANGIYGEVFLDFYERVVKKSKVVTTYASRRDFNSNYENRGFDNMLFRIVDGQIEYIFAESKFVTDKNSATTALVQDIKGTPGTATTTAKQGHLTLEFMNDYVAFVVEKNSFFSESDRNLLKPFFRDLNNVLINQDRKLISFFIEKNIRVKCVFFAIFQCDSVNPKDFIKSYDIIELEAKTHLEQIGITNYYIEIVFIPTKSRSMAIKGAIDAYYE